jgi:fatty-acyl-CoA synthase
MLTINDSFSFALAQSEAVWTFADSNRSFTTTEIDAVVNNCLSKLVSQGLQRQDRVGLALKNGIEMVGYLLACWRLNLIAVPLRTSSGKYLKYEQFLLGCHQSCSFRLVLCDRTIRLDDIDQWRAYTGIAIHSEPAFNPEITKALPQRVKKVRPEDIAVIQFSSGSTGSPKGVIVTHKMMMNQLRHLSENGIRHGVPNRSGASWMPIHHDMGLFTGVLYPIYGQCNNFLATPNYFMRNPTRWFKQLSEKKVNFCFITNSALVATLRSVKRLYADDEIDLSQLHLYISAEKISAQVLKSTKEKFSLLKLNPHHVHSAYGMAENSLGATCSKQGEIPVLRVNIDASGNVRVVTDRNEINTELVSSGIVNSRHRITVRDENDHVLPELKLGEINIESDCLTPGYFKVPELTCARLKAGRLRSGDLGFFYKQELYFFGRKDDLMIIGGRNISPEDIEETIENFDFVRPSSSALVSIENCDTGLMELHLVLEVDVNEHNSERVRKQQTLTLAVLDSHDVLLSCVHFCQRGSVEKTSSGKKRRKIIRQRLIDHQLIEFSGASCWS